MKESKATTIIAILLIIFLLLGAIGFVVGMKKGNNPTPDNPTPTPVTPTPQEGNEVIIENLQEKLGTLDFSPKTDEVLTEGENHFSVNVVDGVATVSYTLNGAEYVQEGTIEKSYQIESVTGVASAGLGFSAQSLKIFLLSSEGRVYLVEDQLNDVVTGGTLGNAVDLTVENATEMAVTRANFSLRDDGDQSTINVYIKTSDGRVFTNEADLLNGNPVIEVK